MDTNERLHHEWLGMAQPEGLVVTASALKTAEANITWPVVELQQQLRELAGEKKHVPDLLAFVRDILDWSADIFVSGSDIPSHLRVHLDGGEWLVPTIAVTSPDESDEKQKFVLLVEETHRTNLDAPGDDKRWTATAHQRFERLLRETNVPTGFLTNGRDFRLVHAPKGESAGWITFRLSEMLTVDGRPLLGALHMLLNERRLVALEDKKRLPALLSASREYQNTVSTKLREQILAALRELLRGFERADRLANGAILHDMRGEQRQEMYAGLVTVLMRFVFVLYAEERGLLPIESDLYASAYSLSRLHALLQADHQRFGDTIDDRYGAWGRVITLFRLLHDGVHAADGLFLPARKGSFFDPDAFPFLEGRPRGSVRQAGEILDLPRVSDGVVYRMLDRLLVLDGERLQYKGLDVEQIGSVYEGLMGFELQVAEGDSVCLLPEHVVVDLEGLLKKPGAERIKELKALANLDVKDKSAGEIKDAKTVELLFGALGKRISPRQPGLLAKGSLYLQPGEERRRTGSHYTPRSLTLPIVETTLRPVLERLGPDVRPEQLLMLKVCDPAMGSGAFLVEACRQLADKLVDAWRRTKTMPDLPRDEEPVLHARRLIAQQCIYGVDKNPLAVDLARLSIWLVTFAKDHPFTFVDHSLRHGDSLVGLSKEQIFNLSLDPAKGAKLAPQARNQLANAVREAEVLRGQIHALGDPPMTDELRDLWDRANEALTAVRTLGDLVIAAFFQESSDKGRKKALEDVWTKGVAWLNNGSYAAELRGMVEDLRKGEKPVPAFHWEIEFPEVFSRENPGFDCFVGNPPFLGGRRISGSLGDAYTGWLTVIHENSSGNADLSAHFFRISFANLRRHATFGFIATNTIAQGDTRSAGLRWIVKNGGTIYNATRRYKWPNVAKVIVSVLHVVKGDAESLRLDEKKVEKITSFLFHQGSDDDPIPLKANANKSFQGSIILGMGFTFDDANENATPIAEMDRLIKKDPRNKERIFPYLGGEELNSTAQQIHRRYVINFGEEDESVAQTWGDLYAILEKKVKPDRLSKSKEIASYPWWQFWRPRTELTDAILNMSRVLATNAQASKYLAFGFLPTGSVFANSLNIFPFAKDSSFGILQSGCHEVWAYFLCSSMKDDLRYNPTDCFETFPFPPDWENNKNLETIGKEYYEFRAALMIRNNEGLTKTYNRFHDPDEPSPEIIKLRELHALMDRAVLDAYGWTDIVPQYDFRPQLDESIRYTWGEETRDEVLARLLELNRVMAAKEAEEAQAAKTNAALEKAEAPKAPRKTAAGKKKGKTKDEGALLFNLDEPGNKGSG